MTIAEDAALKSVSGLGKVGGLRPLNPRTPSGPRQLARSPGDYP
jgi:hypothetical protein